MILSVMVAHLNEFRDHELREDRRVKHRKRKKGGISWQSMKINRSFLHGIFDWRVLGALAGIFFAPKSGKELRSDLRRKGARF